MNSHIENRLSHVQSSFADFFAIANLGDTNSAYRGKPIWINFQTDDICRPVEKLINEVPAARNAVLYFISNLIHENVHLYLLERERKEGSIIKSADYDNLQSVVLRLLARLGTFRDECGLKSSFPLTLLNMLFELLADLYRLNSQRPFFNHQRPSPIVFLRAFLQIPCISDLFALLDSTFNFFLKSATEKAVFTFVSAHKLFYTNFDWVSLHIAETFPSNIAVQLLKVGSEEFCAHCNELLNPTVLSNQNRVIQLQDEYGKRLRLFADIFQYMEKNRKIELRNCFISIVADFLSTGENWREFLFFVKLSLFSPDVVLPFADELLQCIVSEPFLTERLYELVGNPALSIAVSPTISLQSFIRKLAEKANTEYLFDLCKIISPYLT